MYRILPVILCLLAMSCNRLSDRIDRPANPDYSADVERLDRETRAELEGSKFQQVGLEEDLRGLQEWQQKVKDSAAKDVAFNEAIEKQFRPLYSCLSDPENAKCRVLEEIKECLKNPGVTRSPMCTALSELFTRTSDQEARLQAIGNCLTRESAFSINAFTVSWSNDFADCKTLIAILNVTVSMIKEVDGKAARLEKAFNDLNLQVQRQQAAFGKIADLVSSMQRVQTLHTEVIKRSLSDSQDLFIDVKSGANAIRRDDISKCFFLYTALLPTECEPRP